MIYFNIFTKKINYDIILTVKIYLKIRIDRQASFTSYNRDDKKQKTAMGWTCMAQSEPFTTCSIGKESNRKKTYCLSLPSLRWGDLVKILS